MPFSLADVPAILDWLNNVFEPSTPYLTKSVVIFFDDIHYCTAPTYKQSIRHLTTVVQLLLQVLQNNLTTNCFPFFDEQFSMKLDKCGT